jgi:hypothetical protein
VSGGSKGGMKGRSRGRGRWFLCDCNERVFDVESCVVCWSSNGINELLWSSKRSQTGNRTSYRCLCLFPIGLGSCERPIGVLCCPCLSGYYTLMFGVTTGVLELWRLELGALMLVPTTVSILQLTRVEGAIPGALQSISSRNE